MELMEPHYAIALRPNRHLTFCTFDYRLSALEARVAAAKYVMQGRSYGVSALVLAGRKGSGKTHLLTNLSVSSVILMHTMAYEM